MTGYFIRVEREGKFESVEIDQMTDAELKTLFEDQDKKDNGISTRAWAITLAKWIRDNVRGE